MRIIQLFVYLVPFVVLPLLSQFVRICKLRRASFEPTQQIICTRCLDFGVCAIFVLIRNHRLSFRCRVFVRYSWVHKCIVQINLKFIALFQFNSSLHAFFSRLVLLLSKFFISTHPTNYRRECAGENDIKIAGQWKPANDVKLREINYDIAIWRTEHFSGLRIRCVWVCEYCVRLFCFRNIVSTHTHLQAISENKIQPNCQSIKFKWP